MGLCANTLQLALLAHCPTHGFTHRLLMQALSIAHSLFIVHSGRQLGGVPTNSDWQLHTAWELTSRHWLFGPQGDGVQGVGLVISGNTIIVYKYVLKEEWRIINTNIYYSKLLGLNCTYLQPFQHNTCTHCLLNLVDNNMKVYGLPLDIWHLTHTRQGKGLCIYFEHRLALANNLSWWRIQVDILRRDCQ